jgi:hypothetical protein
LPLSAYLQRKAEWCSAHHFLCLRWINIAKINKLLHDAAAPRSIGAAVADPQTDEQPSIGADRDDRASNRNGLEIPVLKTIERIEWLARNSDFNYN